MTNSRTISLLGVSDNEEFLAIHLRGPTRSSIKQGKGAGFGGDRVSSPRPYFNKEESPRMFVVFPRKKTLAEKPLRRERKHFTSKERVDILRSGDCFRKWSSLDDERICIICRKVFTGRHIRVSCDQSGRYLLRCPTKGCPSFLAHWFYLDDVTELPDKARMAGRVGSWPRRNGFCFTSIAGVCEALTK